MVAPITPIAKTAPVKNHLRRVMVRAPNEDDISYNRRKALDFINKEMWASHNDQFQALKKLSQEQRSDYMVAAVNNQLANNSGVSTLLGLIEGGFYAPPKNDILDLI